jgi:predicted small metal-binding protein
MNRYCVDCRDHPSEVKCSVALSADTKEELLEAVVQHATTVHGYEDTAELRKMVFSGIKEGTSC